MSIGTVVVELVVDAEIVEDALIAAPSILIIK